MALDSISCTEPGCSLLISLESQMIFGCSFSQCFKTSPMNIHRMASANIWVISISNVIKLYTSKRVYWKLKPIVKEAHKSDFPFRNKQEFPHTEASRRNCGICWCVIWWLSFIETEPEKYPVCGTLIGKKRHNFLLKVKCDKISMRRP